MKTAVSIPDDVFREAERLAARLRTSRSRLYARALGELLARYDDDHITAAMNGVLDQVGDSSDDFARRAAHRVLQRVEW